MSENKNENPNKMESEKEVDLISLAKTIWEDKKTVLRVTLIFLVLGLFVAIFSKKEYTASTTFISQAAEANVGGGLGGLAAMAGINLGGMGADSGIQMILYPEIANSILFQKELLQTPLTIEGYDRQVTLKEYFLKIKKSGVVSKIKKYTIGLPGVIVKLFRKEPEQIAQNSDEEQIASISKEEKNLLKILESMLLIDVNDEDGYITVYVRFPERLGAAQLARKTQELLQKYIIDFKIQKSKEQLNYIKERYDEVEKKFVDVQLKLAKFEDKNKFVNTAMSKIELQTIQDEYNLIYNVYVELAKQLEAQYLQVTEDTPVFTIIKPVFVPIEKSKPKRLFIVFFTTFLGSILGSLLVFGKLFIRDLKEKWDQV